MRRVKAGTLVALLAYLVSDENEDPDLLESFVLTYATFTAGTLVHHVHTRRSVCESRSKWPHATSGSPVDGEFECDFDLNLEWVA